jgi:hypothetical protein
VLALLLALTLHVAGTPTRRATAQCQLLIVARVVEGGRQRVCLTEIGGTGRYRHARGTVTGSGTVVDTARRLSDVRLAYHLVIRASA